MSEELKNYIKQAREQGLSNERIKTNLKENGWEEKDLDGLFSGDKNLIFDFKHLFIKRNIIFLPFILISLVNSLVFIICVIITVYYNFILLFFNKKKFYFYFILFLSPVYISILSEIFIFESSCASCIIYIPGGIQIFFLLLFVNIFILTDYNIVRSKFVNNNRLDLYKSVSIYKIISKINLFIASLVFFFSILNIYFLFYIYKYKDIFVDNIRYAYTKISISDFFVMLFSLIIFFLVYLFYKKIKNTKEIKKAISIFNVILLHLLLIYLYFTLQHLFSFEKHFRAYKHVKHFTADDMKGCGKYNNERCTLFRAIYLKDADYCYNIPYTEINKKSNIKINKQIICFSIMNKIVGNNACDKLEKDEDKKACIKFNRSRY